MSGIFLCLALGVAGLITGLFGLSFRHGNHCGYDYGDKKRPAVDKFDQCCYNHDRCLENGGFDMMKITCHEILGRCVMKTQGIQ